MNIFDKYMQDKTIENSLTKEAKEKKLESLNFGRAISLLEGTEITNDEFEYIKYCSLNNIPDEVGIQNILRERRLPLIDFEKAKNQVIPPYQGTVKL